MYQTREELRQPLKRQMMVALREDLAWAAKRSKEFDLIFRGRDAVSDDKVGPGLGIYPFH